MWTCSNVNEKVIRAPSFSGKILYSTCAYENEVYMTRRTVQYRVTLNVLFAYNALWVRFKSIYSNIPWKHAISIP
jgi:hypothetical protein